MVTPSLTTVTAPVDELGEAALKLLQDRIENPTAEPSTITLAGTPVLRDSTSPN
jgi:LacI family transcriptional regulator